MQIGPATLVMNIQALANEADEVTDPNVEVATNNTPSFDNDDNTDDEELVEFGLDGLIESIQNSTATGAKTHLAIHQVFGTDIIAMKSFTSGDTDIQMGSEIGTKLRFAGKAVAWVPSGFSALSWAMYPFTETKSEWKKSSSAFRHT